MPITLEDARPGMVLTADVKDRRGRLLLTAGHELTTHALRVFRMWGVTGLDVAGAEAVAAAEPGPADVVRLEAVRADVADRFRHADRAHPVVAALFDLAVARTARDDDADDDAAR